MGRKISSCLLSISLLLLASACGNDAGRFRIDGRLMNINQGEFYVYSPDGLIDRLDTILVAAGRFNYDIAIDRAGTLCIVFPNFSEQPIYAEPGRRVTVKGDVTHLKDLKVKGQSKDPSLPAIYAIYRDYIRVDEPDYATAAALMDSIAEANPDNGALAMQVKRLKARGRADVGQRLPRFTAVTIDGDTITEKAFAKGDGVIYLWASYEYESCNIQRQLRARKDSLNLLGISIDATQKDCRKTLDKDKITTPIANDSLLFDGPLVRKLAMSSLPDNIVVKDGVIVARGLVMKELTDRFPKSPLSGPVPARR